MNRLSLRKQPVEVGDFRKFTGRFRGIYGIYSKGMKAKPGDPKPITALVALLRKNRWLVADEPVEFEKTTR